MLHIDFQNIVSCNISEKEVHLWAHTAHQAVKKIENSKASGDVPIESNSESEVVVRLVDEPEAKMLNQSYRNKPYPTNVLSFVYENELSFEPNDGINLSEGSETDTLTPLKFLGDIIICDAVIKQEAVQQNKDYKAHFAHMVVHGILHLHGYDHEEERDAEKMEQLEVEILDRLNIHNPYI